MNPFSINYRNLTKFNRFKRLYNIHKPYQSIASVELKFSLFNWFNYQKIIKIILTRFLVQEKFLERNILEEKITIDQEVISDKNTKKYLAVI